MKKIIITSFLVFALSVPNLQAQGKSLFNGKDLKGWIIYGTEKWYVEDGLLVCESGPDEEYGYLGTKKHYKNFELNLDFKQEADGNSGVFIRSTIEGVKVSGWQVEVAPKGKHTGGVYESYGRGCQTNPKDKLQASNFKVGIIADCQYCYCDTQGERFYKKSPLRLMKAVDSLNNKDLSYTIHLGDFIDRDFNSFDTLLPIWNKLRSKKYHVLGNHEFSVANSSKSKVFNKLNIKDRYYSFLQDNWRFIVLDGNDLSFHGALSAIKKQQTDSIYNLYEKDSLDYLQKWNGALSKEQLHWVRSELEIATKNKENVGFYCHFPALPFDNLHNLWNRNDLIALISEYPNVKFFFNGHNHGGGYEVKDGVHYLTFKAMVNTDDSNSYATAFFTKDSIFISGYGREISRRLKIK